MTETPEIPESDVVVKETPAIPLRDRASRTMKVLWTGVGALATMGGVVGLVQVISSNTMSDRPVAESPQDKILAMVESGNVSPQEAERLARVLYGEEGTPDSGVSDAIQTLASTGSDRQKEAIQMIGLRHSREAGFDLLEGEAETSDDWLLIAQLSYGRDIERSLKAIRKSIALNPENFRAVALLSQIQARKGDYSAAERSAKTAEMLADTPEQEVMARQASLSILTSVGNLAALPDSIKSLEDASQRYDAATNVTNIPDRFETTKALENHPAWMMAVSHQTVGNARYVLKDYEAAKVDLSRTIALYENLLPAAPDDDRSKVMRRIGGAYNSLVYVAYLEEDKDELVRLANLQLDIGRRIAETGEARGIADLPSIYQTYSGYLFWADKKPAAVEAMGRAVELGRAAVARRPDDADLAIDAVNLELSHAMMKESMGLETDLEDSLGAILTDLETALTGTTDEEADDEWSQYRAIVFSLIRFFREYESERGEDIPQQVYDRAIDFLDREIASRPDAHDPRHTRFYLLHTNALHIAETDGYEAGKAALEIAMADGENIPATEEEPDVVPLTRLTLLHSLVSLKGGDVEPKDRPELDEALKLARSLDAQGKLTTAYQQYLNDLISIQDGTKVWTED